MAFCHSAIIAAPQEMYKTGIFVSLSIAVSAALYQEGVLQIRKR